MVEYLLRMSAEPFAVDVPVWQVMAVRFFLLLVFALITGYVWEVLVEIWEFSHGRKTNEGIGYTIWRILFGLIVIYDFWALSCVHLLWSQVNFLWVLWGLLISVIFVIATAIWVVAFLSSSHDRRVLSRWMFHLRLPK